jgi:cell division protease FtsH
VNVNWRGALVYILILIAAGALIMSLFPMQSGTEEIAVSQVIEDINDSKIASITVEGNELQVTYKGGQEVISRKEADVDVTQNLLDLGAEPTALEAVDIEVTPASAWADWLAILGSFVPFVLVAVLFLFLMRQAQGTNNQALSFGKSRARMFTGEKPTVTFDDVAGVEEAKQELAEVGSPSSPSRDPNS